MAEIARIAEGYATGPGGRVSGYRVEADPNSKEDLEAASAVVFAQVRATLIQQVSLYILAGLFIIVAQLLIVFAPDGRETPTTIVALALFALAAGIAGFAYFRLKLPGVSATAGTGAPEPEVAIPVRKPKMSRKVS